MRTCQIKSWANPGSIGKACHLCKSFLTRVWSLLWCIPVEPHLQDCQKTKCIFSTPSKSLIKKCLMKPKGYFSILVHFLCSQEDIYEDGIKMTHNFFFFLIEKREIHNPQISNEKFKCHSSSRGEPERGVCFISRSVNANFKSTAFTVYKNLPHCEKGTFTTLTYNMTRTDIESLTTHSSAVFLPISEGLILLFGTEETGKLWFSNVWPQPSVLKSLFKAEHFENIRFSAVGVYMGQRWNWYNTVLKIFWGTLHLAGWCCYLCHFIMGCNVLNISLLLCLPGLIYLGLIPGNNNHTFS